VSQFFGPLCLFHNIVEVTKEFWKTREIGRKGIGWNLVKKRVSYDRHGDVDSSSSMKLYGNRIAFSWPVVHSSCTRLYSSRLRRYENDAPAFNKQSVPKYYDLIHILWQILTKTCVMLQTLATNTGHNTRT
jgi:hypothetical protein